MVASTMVASIMASTTTEAASATTSCHSMTSTGIDMEPAAETRQIEAGATPQAGGTQAAGTSAAPRDIPATLGHTMLVLTVDRWQHCGLMAALQCLLFRLKIKILY